MATTEEILVKYTLDIAELKGRVTQLEGELKKAGAAGESAGKKTEDAFKRGAKAAKEAKDATSDFKDKGLAQLDSGLQKIGGAVIAAFAVERILAFGSAAIDAFAEAENASKRLQFAVTKVLGGTTAQVAALEAQANKLQDISYFDADDIKAAQTMLIQFGLTTEQVQQLTPSILDLSVALGTDLQGAASVAISAIEGQTRGLKQVGANFKDTGSAIGNYNELIVQLSKLQGTAAADLETTSGKLKEQQRVAEDLSESVGGSLANGWLAAKTAFLSYADKVITGAKFLIAPGATMDEIRAANKAKALADQAELTRQQNQNKQLGELNKARREAERDLGNLNRQLVDEATRQSKQETGEVGKVRIETLQKVALKEKEVEVLKQLQAEKERGYEFDKLRAVAVDKLSKQELQTQLDALNAKKKAGDNTKELADEIERREKAIEKINDKEAKAAEKSAQAAQQAAEKRKQALADLDKIAQDAATRALTLEAQTEEAKLRIQRDAAIEAARIKFNEAGGSTSTAAVEAFNKAELAITQEYAQRITDARIAAITKANAERNKLVRDGITKDSETELNAISLQAQQDILALKQAYIAKGDFSKAAEKKLAEDITEIQLAEERKRVEAQRRVRETLYTNAYNDAVANAFQIALVEEKGNVQRALQNDKYLESVATATETYNDAKLTSDTQYAQATTALDIKATDTQTANIKGNAEAREIDNEAKIRQALETTGAIIDAVNAVTDAQIQARERELQALQESYDAESAALQQQFDNRLIGAAELDIQQRKLNERKLADEKRIQAEILKLKRQEDTANKLKAIFEIGINTALAISKVLTNPFMIALVATLGAAQLAAVLATPLPQYRRGTKYLKRGNNPSGVDTIPIMADEGERIVSAKQNKKYWSVYEAIDDGKFEEYMHDNYIAPHMQAAKQAYDSNTIAAANVAVLQQAEIDYDLLASKIGAELEWRNRKGYKVQGMPDLLEALNKREDPRKR